MTTADLQRLYLRYADGFGLFTDNEWNLPPHSLVLGWIEQESAWNPHAIRFEPAFHARYVPEHLRGSTEGIARAISWGLGQIMGQVARERGFDSRYLSELADPALNASVCCAYLADRHTRTNESWKGALAAYNGGLGGNLTPPYRNASYAESIVERAREFAHDR